MYSKDLKIEIRPIPNRDRLREYSSNLEYFSQSHVLSCLVNPITMKYATGLSDEDKEYLKENNFPYDISDTYIKGKPHPFWENQIAKVELKNTPFFLFPGRSLLDFVRYKWLLQSRLIYKSEAEMLQGTKPKATHYIYNESDEIKIKATKIQKLNKLNKLVSELTLQRKRDIILILLNENTDNKDEEYLTVRFQDIIHDKSKSIELQELLEKDEDYIDISADVKSAIQKNVLRRTSKGIFFFETNLGYSEDDVILSLMKLENQEMLLNIKNKIK